MAPRGRSCSIPQKKGRGTLQDAQGDVPSEVIQKFLDVGDEGRGSQQFYDALRRIHGTNDGQTLVGLQQTVEKDDFPFRNLNQEADGYAGNTHDGASITATGRPSKSEMRVATSSTAVTGEFREEVIRLRQILNVRQEQTAMLIHDFKGPLGEIVANLDLLSSEELSDTQREYVETAQQGCNALLQMVLNLLDVHKMEEERLLVRKDKIHFQEVIAECMASLRKTAAAKEVRLELHCLETKGALTGDRLLLERVVLNLLMNSIEFSPEGGVITLRLVSPPSGDRVTLTVSDQGKGIPPQYRDTIFDKFAQVERDGKKRRLSMGLGLTFCKMAVEAHGGRIWVENQSDRGSTFAVELPAAMDLQSDS